MDFFGMIDLVTSKMRQRTNITASECAIAAVDGFKEGNVIFRCVMGNHSDVPVSITRIMLKIGNSYAQKAHLKSREIANYSTTSIPVIFAPRESKLCYFVFSAQTKGITDGDGYYSVCPDLPELLFQLPNGWEGALSFSTLLSMLPSHEVPVELELSTTCRQLYIPVFASVQSYDTL